MDIGDRIKKLREEKDMTLEDLGNKVGVGKSTVRKWETGMIANMRRDKILKIAEALGTTPGYLIGWREPTNSNSAEILADIAGDPNLIECIAKINTFSKEEREKVFDYIDLVYYKKISKS